MALLLLSDADWDNVFHSVIVGGSIVAAVGQVIRRTIGAANRYLREEFDRQITSQTQLLTSRITEVNARVNMIAMVGAAVSVTAAAVLTVLSVRGLGPGSRRPR